MIVSGHLLYPPLFSVHCAILWWPCCIPLNDQRTQSLSCCHGQSISYISYSMLLLYLHKHVFWPVFCPVGCASSIYCVAFSGTWPHNYTPSFVILTALHFLCPLLFVAGLKNLEQQNIVMKQQMCNKGGFVKFGLATIVNFLKTPAQWGLYGSTTWNLSPSTKSPCSSIGSIRTI